MKLIIAVASCLFLLGPSLSNAQQLSARQATDLNAVEKPQSDKLQSASDDKIPVRTHEFLDLQGKIANGVDLSFATLDAIGTCRTLAAGGREEWLPSQHCGAISAMIAAGVAFDISLSYIFHRRGHHRLERIMEILGSADSVAGVAFTATHGGRW